MDNGGDAVPVSRNARKKNEPEMKTGTTYVHGSREEAIGRILDKLEAQLMGEGAMKGTVADYLRLIQVMKEMGDERPREIEIRWVNSLREENGR